MKGNNDLLRDIFSGKFPSVETVSTDGPERKQFPFPHSSPILHFFPKQAPTLEECIPHSGNSASFLDHI